MKNEIRTQNTQIITLNGREVETTEIYKDIGDAFQYTGTMVIPTQQPAKQATKPQYTVKSIEKVTRNGVQIKLFKAFELRNDAYVFFGEFTAPAKTANKNLTNYIQL